MAKYRDRLPQCEGGLFLTDGGIETTLIFHDGLDLPYFAAFDLLRTAHGRNTLRHYFTRHATIARTDGLGFILESPTWRASPDWAGRIGYSAADLDRANRQAIDLLREVRDDLETTSSPMVISGCVGPRGDGYDPAEVMSVPDALDYHATQIGTFADTAADVITAITMTNVPEAIGVTRAAGEAGMPVVISFTVETDGTLPTGQALDEAISEVDAETDAAPAYFMVNCAHPSHFDRTFADGTPDWLERVGGIRANASRCSHAELDAATELDDGNPVELGGEYRSLLTDYPHIRVLGGCCGTDHRHIEQISQACRAA